MNHIKDAIFYSLYGTTLSEYKRGIMRNREEEARKNRTNPVYSSTCDGGWPERDALPTGDPVGDVNEDTRRMIVANATKKIEEAYKKDLESYIHTMKDRLFEPKEKYFGIDKGATWIKEETCCSNPDKYKNVISSNMKFWSCRNCGADLGNI